MMTTSYISSLSLLNAPRNASMRLLTEIDRANQEVVSGRFADTGLALGSQVGRSFALRQSAAEITALQDGNGATALRLSTSQTVLQQIQKSTDTQFTSLTALTADKRIAAMAASSTDMLTSFTSLLNTTAGGQRLFSGINTDVAPIRDGAASNAKAAAIAAFKTDFGFAPSDSRAATLTAAQIKTFLEGTVATQFADANWSATWSRASGTVITSQISLSESVTTSVTANATAFRQLAEATTLAGLDLTGLSADAQAVVSDRVMSLLSKSSAGLVSLQADLGRSQARLTDANTRLAAQSTFVTKEISQIEAVDTVEAKTRLDAATKQLNISYALTAQLQGLSLLKYVA